MVTDSSEHLHAALCLCTHLKHTCFNPRTLHCAHIYKNRTTFVDFLSLIPSLSLSLSLGLGGLLCLHRACCIVRNININTSMLQRRQSLCRTDVGGNRRPKISVYKAQLRTWNLIFFLAGNWIARFCFVFLISYSFVSSSKMKSRTDSSQQ